jgi:hypothetical protein
MTRDQRPNVATEPPEQLSVKKRHAAKIDPAGASLQTVLPLHDLSEALCGNRLRRDWRKFP